MAEPEGLGVGVGDAGASPFTPKIWRLQGAIEFSVGAGQRDWFEFCSGKNNCIRVPSRPAPSRLIPSPETPCPSYKR